MNPKVTISLSESYNDGKVVIKEFEVRDKEMFKDIMDKLQNCRVKGGYTVYSIYNK